MATKPLKINEKMRLFQAYSNSAPLDVTPGAGFLGENFAGPFVTETYRLGHQQVLDENSFFLPKKKVPDQVS